jgi:hypothetical protein
VPAESSDRPSAPSASPPSDELVALVTDRVLARLAPAVAETLRRLVQQEADRLRREH